MGIIDHLATAGPYSTYAYVKLTWNRQLTTLNSRPESLRERVELIHHRGIAEPIFIKNLFPTDGTSRWRQERISPCNEQGECDEQKKCGLLVQGPMKKSRVPMKQRLLTEPGSFVTRNSREINSTKRGFRIRKSTEARKASSDVRLPVSFRATPTKQ